MTSFSAYHCRRKVILNKEQYQSKWFLSICSCSLSLERRDQQTVVEAACFNKHIMQLTEAIFRELKKTL
jgi:hypothetical protein